MAGKAVHGGRPGLARRPQRLGAVGAAGLGPVRPEQPRAGLPAERSVNREGRAAPRRAGGGDVAADQLHDAAHRRQSQAAAAAALGGEERLTLP
jgi:hypothetical protein